jgi:uncharacterized membrane protein YphA (DoxX/SURF4 family)
MTRLTAGIRFLLAGVFLLSGALKLADPKAFARVVEQYGIVPDGLALVVVALAIPIAEIAAGAGVLLDRRAGYGLMAGLLALFLAVLGFGIAHDLDVACGCISLGKPGSQGSLKAALARDVVMLAGVVWCLLRRRGPGPSQRLRSSPS